MMFHFAIAIINNHSLFRLAPCWVSIKEGNTMTTAIIPGVNTEEKGANLDIKPKIIGIPKETYPNECRVAATPDTATKLQKLGFEIWVESGAGAAANFADEAYRSANCQVVENAITIWQDTDLILKVRPPSTEEIAQFPEGKTLVSFLWPAQNSDLLEQLANRKATAIAMDAIPRSSRAQKMDALSSMANIAGYRAVIEAANNFGRFFTGQITAAGKVPPAKVMVIGAGVAGLAAIGAATSVVATPRSGIRRSVRGLREAQAVSHATPHTTPIGANRVTQERRRISVHPHKLLDASYPTRNSPDTSFYPTENRPVSPKSTQRSS